MKGCGALSFSIFKPGPFWHRASLWTGAAHFALENTGLEDVALTFCDYCISEYTTNRHFRELLFSNGSGAHQLRNLLFSKYDIYSKNESNLLFLLWIDRYCLSAFSLSFLHKCCLCFITWDMLFLSGVLMDIKRTQNSVLTNSHYCMRMTRSLRFDVNIFIIVLLVIRHAVNLLSTIL